MELGFVGLGKMGLNMTRRLRQDGHEIVVHDVNAEARESAAEVGARPMESLEALVEALSPPRAVWIMVPAGPITAETITRLGALLSAGDVIIDGGNSNYRETMEHGRTLAEKGIRLLDAGTSGGVWGLEIGYCLMIGGEEEAFSRLEPIFKSLAPERGYARVGPSGSGHFVKMTHNGIEYAMMQAYAEGFELLKAKQEFNLDLESIAGLWNRGSVIRSWLLELAEEAFHEDPGLDAIRGYVEDSGEGRWTVENAIDLRVPAPTIAMALFARFRSRQEENFGNKVLAALRNQFGGHAVKKK